MAHMLTESDTMVAIGKAPWHGLGTVLPEGSHLTLAEALEYAGLSVPVTKAPAYALLADGSYARIPDGYATVRGSDPLASVGKDYTVLQDAVGMAPLEEAIQDGRARWETMGRLRGGRVVWGLARLNASFEVLPGDEVSTYALVSNSHDGSRKACVSLTPIRVVCHNTLTASDAGKTASNSQDARHTSGVVATITSGAQRLGIIREQIQATAEVYRAMAATSLTAARILSYVTEIYPDPEDKDTSNVRVRNIREAILKLHEDGYGHEIPGVRGSLWGAYNAITEYVDHERGGKITAAKADTRLESVWFGSGRALKARAMEVAKGMVRA